MKRSLLAFLTIFITFSSWKAHAAPSTLEAALLSSTEADPNAFIDHRVNVINGDYCETITDLVIKGPDDLIMQRYYSNSNYITGKGAGSWRIFPQCWLTVGKDPKGKSCSISGTSYHWTYAYTGERSGGILTYSGWQSKTSKDKGLQVWAFRDGRSISNTAHGEMSGKVNVQSNLLRYQADSQDYILTLGDGSKRFFEQVDSLPSSSLGEELNLNTAAKVHESEYYRLTLEILPSGNKVRYQYDEKGHLTRIEMLNATEEKTFSWISLKRQESGKQLLVTTSDERSVTYHLNGPQIVRVKHSYQPEVSYSYNNQGKLTEKKLSDKVSQVSYDANMRVSSILEAEGDSGQLTPIREFSYGSGYTEVFNAIGQRAIYRYSKKGQLEAVEYYDRTGCKYRVDRKYWDFERETCNNLVAKTIEDGNGNTLSCRYFSYDANGNIIEERLYGNLTGKSEDYLSMGKNGQIVAGEEDDCHIRKMEYSTDGFNLITKMGDCKGNEIFFEYLPGTNRLTKKLIKDNNISRKIKKRFFYTYNNDGVLTQTIEDDGSQEDPNRISGWSVTERHIIDITSKENLPGVGLPLTVLEQAAGSKDKFEIHLLKKTVNSFDSQGRLIKEDTYDAGASFQYSREWKYDNHGNLLEEVDPEGKQTLYQYDAIGSCMLKQLPQINTTSEFSYDMQGNITEIREHYANIEYILTNSYDLLGQKVSSTDRKGNRTDFEYDQKGFLSKVIFPAMKDSDGNVSRPTTSYENDIFGNPLKTTDARGHVMLKRFNLRGDPISIDYPDGTFELFKYDPEGSLHRHLTRDKIISIYEYDFLGRQVNEERSSAGENGSDSYLDNTFCTYSSYHLKQVKDKRAITGYEYDFAGRVSKVFRPSSFYQEKDDAESRKEEYIYDSLGRIAKKILFFDKGKDDYIVERLEYDIAGRVIEKAIEDAGGETLKATRYIYDYKGLLLEEQALLSGVYVTVAKTAYNELGEPISLIDAEGKETLFQYEDVLDEAGQTVSKKIVVDPSGVSTEMIFDAFGRIVAISKIAPTGELLSSQFLTYDLAGNKTLEENLTVSSKGQGETQMTRWVYGPMNHIDEMCEASGSEVEKVTHYTYGKDGKLNSKLLPGCETPVTYTYNKKGWLEKVDYREGSKHLHISNSYSYDTRGNITSAQSLHGKSIKRSYNSFDDLVRETIKDEAGEYSVHYEYDRKGRVTLIRLPDNSEIQYTYDSLHGRSVSKVSPSGTTLYTHEYLDHDEWGRLKEEKMIGFAGHKKKEWDLSNRLISMESEYYKEKVPQGGYDPIGNLLQLNREGEFDPHNLSFTYNFLSQIISEDSHEHKTYTYDSIGNRQQKNTDQYNYDSLNQLLKTGSDEYEYDLRGSLLRCSRNGKKWNLESNILGQLSRLQNSDGTVLEFNYGPLGRRLAKKHFDSCEKNRKRLSLSRYLYIGEQEVGRIDESGKICELRIPGLINEEPAGESVALELNNKIFAPLHNTQGNIIALVDPQWREVVEYYTYSSFGEEVIHDTYGDPLDESEAGNPWRYAGKRVDGETGLSFFGWRFYDPTIGRWISPDPALFIDGPNLYAFAQNNPLHYIDRFGLSTENRNSEGFDNYFYGEVESHCYCERHRTCKRGGDLDKSLTYGPEVALVRFLDNFENSYTNKSRLYNLSSEDGFQKLTKGMISFINGIDTAFEDALSHSEYIGNLAGGYNIHGVYNATHGKHVDANEYLMNKDYFATPPVRQLHKQWDDYFANADAITPILQICHSQGAALLRNALMTYPKELRERIIVIAVAPGAYIHPSLCKQVTHYASKWNRDIVPWLDLNGRVANRGNIISLRPHKNSPTFDHSFQSPTYQTPIADQVISYISKYGA